MTDNGFLYYKLFKISFKYLQQATSSFGVIDVL